MKPATVISLVLSSSADQGKEITRVDSEMMDDGFSVAPVEAVVDDGIVYIGKQSEEQKINYGSAPAVDGEVMLSMSVVKIIDDLILMETAKRLLQKVTLWIERWAKNDDCSALKLE
ncbi:hypothetical protein L2E82_44997 [Cichorium intybus]|uniref:Uncharacterized protein n=1 Tax=Cichorium intybus TaxID=13427 RepID=A0ACB8ZRN6_CICIN|nr:hypothetical protein L2E82_44997 [Cichorium intybus]